MKPFLILQLRVIDEAADQEFEAIMKYGGLERNEVVRIRMEKESFDSINACDFAGIIVGGGPSNVSDDIDKKPGFQIRFENELDQLYASIIENDIPFFGTCYGLGSMVKYAGGIVSKEKYSEPVGYTEIHLNDDGREDPLFSGLPDSFIGFCGHKEACQTIPEEAVLLGSSDLSPVQIIRMKHNIYAVQFHCELDGPGMAKRIVYYKNHGYFDPKESEAMIRRYQNVKTEIPQIVLKRFVDRYSTKKM
ncbi:glutamine amidotransferase [Mangrovivirga sp. M17]|uniref:Glutamine amidotransferase n=1 Tax=Mangrovivirga halotolerans TaxID=2993936 RepID=A0ABT3RRK2_9BACT|nr:glutamine amidotransferase [Mangrovivirga halotolerans]MCX2744126.1 glutamine amidotransferase [Mangrovivirga halotolerans]